MTDTAALATIRERNRRKRLFGWIGLYLLLLAAFAVSVYWQAKRVNTLDFAKGTVQLTVSHPKYTVGDPITYTLHNNLATPLTLLNTCPQEPLYVYSWTNNTWVRIHATAAASACAGQPAQRTINPGGTYTQSFAAWPDLFNKPGIYRIVGLSTNYTALPYADFQVVSKPVTPVVQTQVVIQKVITPVYITVPSSGGGGGDD